MQQGRSQVNIYNIHVLYHKYSRAEGPDTRTKIGGVPRRGRLGD